MVRSILCVISTLKEESVMESWTTTSLPLSAAKGPPLSGAKGADDGGRPEVGVPAGQSGVRSGESAVGSPVILSEAKNLGLSPLRERTRAGFFASLRMTSTEASLFDEPV